MQTIINDVRKLTDVINRRWERDRCPWGVWSEAQHIHDVGTLRRIIDWSLAQPSVLKAALRLQATLADITAKQRAEIELLLRVADLCVVRVLAQQPDGSWIRRIEEAA